MRLDNAWKAKLKGLVPKSIYNRVMLTMPFLYRTNLVRYESNLNDEHGIDELISQLAAVARLPGDIIECGSSRCGTSIIMADYMRANALRKMIYACDSFEGFDSVELEKERALGLTTAPQDAFTSTSHPYVVKKIRLLGFSHFIVPLKGYFTIILPQLIRDKTFCLALIDCDLYDSIIYCANQVWSKLVPGGCIVFDDYLSDGFRGAKLAIDHFIEAKTPEIEKYGLMSRLFYARKQKKS